MPIGAAIGSVVGGGIAAGGAMYAAGKQSDAAKDSLALQKQMYSEGTARQADYVKQGQDTLSPFIDTGKGAMYSLAQLYGIGGAGGEAFNDNALEAFRKSPDYDWRLKEGTRALDFSASAKGTLGSRGHLNNTVAFGQGLASQGLGDYTKAGEKTQELDNLITANALSQLKSIFGAAPTEGERKILLDIQGSVGKTDKVRRAIYERAVQMAETRLDFNKQRANELRGGEYYKKKAPPGAPAATNAQPAADGKPAAPAAPAAPAEMPALPAGFQMIPSKRAEIDDALTPTDATA